MSAIKVGDTVLVIRGHCTQKAAGAEYNVLAVGKIPRLRCNVCDVMGPKGYGALLHHGRAPLSWLMKIDPPAEMQSTERERETT